MSFAVSMIIGDKNGVVGLGTGKGNETALAIAKALKDEQERANTLYCRYYALYDLCQEITMFGYSKESEERLIELVRKEALEE